MRQDHRIAIALGSNLGDRLETLQKAAERLAEEFLDGARSSSVYETPPWGVTDQPTFLNAVVVGECEWKPPAILNFLKSLERELGRVPGPRYGPRAIDLDLLAYGEECWSSEGLEVPHSEMANRDFVLTPLAEVWPEWKHPRLGLTAEELCERLARTIPSDAKRVAAPLLDTASQ